MGQQLISVGKYLSIYIGPICSTFVSSPAILDVTALITTIVFRTQGRSNAVYDNWTICLSLPILALNFLFENLQSPLMSSFVACVTDSLVSCNNFCNFLSALSFQAQTSLFCLMRAP
jgi:hypothetical protein